METSFNISPIGIIHNNEKEVKLEIFKPFWDGLLGIEPFSHFMVFFWFHQNDTPEKRAVLQVHPRRDRSNPLTGVFGTHSPLRPNLIGLTFCKKQYIETNCIHIEKIDALDQTPLIDIKPHIPLDELESAEIRVPDWV